MPTLRQRPIKERRGGVSNWAVPAAAASDDSRSGELFGGFVREKQDLPKGVAKTREERYADRANRYEPEPVLPTGVYKAKHGKFQAIIKWSDKPRDKRFIGSSFDTPEQAAAAYMSVRNDLDAANLSSCSADEVNDAFEAAKKKAKKSFARERRLPTGVHKASSGKFRSMISWGGKRRIISSAFDTPEQASAAYASVKKDLDEATLYSGCADEVNSLFDAAQKKAVERVGAVVPKKRKYKSGWYSSSKSKRAYVRGVYKTSSGGFQAMTLWCDKKRYIGSFYTLDQASAAYESVKKDLDEAKLSGFCAAEVDSVFNAAKNKALKACGVVAPKQKRTKASSGRGISHGVRKTKYEQFVTSFTSVYMKK